MFFSFSKKWGLLFLPIFLSGLYIISPYITLWSISKAIQNHDTPKLLTYLDWQSVKKNLQQTIQPLPTSSDELPEFGNSFASTAVSNAIDIAITPKNLAQFISHIGQNPPSKPSSNLNTLLRAFLSTHIHFLSLFSLQAEIVIPDEQQRNPIQMIMVFQDMSWKVTSIKFPDQYTSQLFQQTGF